MAGLYDVGTFGPAGGVGRRRGRERRLAGVAGRACRTGGRSAAMNAASSNSGVAGRADEVGRHAAPGEERLEVDRRAVDGGVAAAGPLDLGDLEAAALGGLGDGLGLEDARRRTRRSGWRTAAPLMWNVLLVDPWTPGQAPVARLYQPAPVFGGAWVSRPLPVAYVAVLEERAHRRHQRPARRTRATRSWRRPSAAKKTALSSCRLASLSSWWRRAADGGPRSDEASRRDERPAATTERRIRARVTWTPPADVGHDAASGRERRAGDRTRTTTADRTDSVTDASADRQQP